MITNAHYTRETDQEYEIFWNGVNDGHDGDLLNPERRTPEKSAGQSRKAHDGSIREAVFHALPTRQKDAATFRELVVLTGCLPSSVNSALHLLRLEGRLASEELPTAHHYKARPPQRYWRRA